MLGIASFCYTLVSNLVPDKVKNLVLANSAVEEKEKKFVVLSSNVLIHLKNRTLAFVQSNIYVMK